MANLSITIPDTLVPTLVAAALVQWPELTGLTNAQIGQTVIKNTLKQLLIDYAALTAVDAAVVTYNQNIEAAKTKAAADADTIT